MEPTLQQTKDSMLATTGRMNVGGKNELVYVRKEKRLYRTLALIGLTAIPVSLIFWPIHHYYEVLARFAFATFSILWMWRSDSRETEINQRLEYWDILELKVKAIEQAEQLEILRNMVFERNPSTLKAKDLKKIIGSFETVILKALDKLNPFPSAPGTDINPVG